MASLQQLHRVQRPTVADRAPRHAAVSAPAVFRPALFAARKAHITMRPAISSVSTRAGMPPNMGPMGEEFDANNKKYAELTKSIEAAAAAAQENLQGTSIYLVGMMGSGKSTVGKLVSQALGYCYFDTDALIEQLAGKSIPEIFADDGEDDFRAIETQVLQELAPFKNCIISTGGGAPTKGENWGHMAAGISIWLNGSPTLLAHRVVRDGTENRPLLADKEPTESTDQEELEKTVEKLAKLLEQRREQYAYADIVVSLEGDDPATADFGAPAAMVALRVLQSVNDRIARDAAMREDRKNFEVVNENLPPTMRVVQSINPPAADSDPYLP